MKLYQTLNHSDSLDTISQPRLENEPSQSGRQLPEKVAIALNISDKPVIAVLPFVNLSGNPNQEFFADGLTEDIITRLGYLRGAMVISRTSSFVFKGASKRAEEISLELGAKYLVEGSVRIAGDRVRIVAKLIDAEKDVPLWTSRFDRQMDDIFVLQDEITHEIVEALQIAITDGEMVRDPGGTRDFAAWGFFHQGALAHLNYTAEDSLVARNLFARAFEQDPDFIDARVFHAWTYWQDARSGFATDPGENLAVTRQARDALLKTDVKTAGIKHLEAATLLLERDFDAALSAAAEAVALGPSRLFGYTPAALVNLYCGKYQDAADLLREGIRTIPYTPPDTIYNLSIVLGLLDDEQTAVPLAEENMRRVPKDLYAYTALVIACARCGLSAEANGMMETFRQRFPNYRLSHYAAHEPFRDADVLENTLEILRKAGLPE